MTMINNRQQQPHQDQAFSGLPQVEEPPFSAAPHIDDLRLWSNLSGLPLAFLARNDNLKMVQNQANIITLKQQQQAERASETGDSVLNRTAHSSTLAGNIEAMRNQDLLARTADVVKDAQEGQRNWSNPIKNMVAGPGYLDPSTTYQKDQGILGRKQQQRTKKKHWTEIPLAVQTRYKYFPPTPSTRVPLTNENTKKWLCRAIKSGKEGYVDPYSYLNIARNVYSLDKLDSNLIAAERYMEGYDGTYSDFWIVGQSAQKEARKKLNYKRGNGSPLEDNDFITSWGIEGNKDRETGVSIGYDDLNNKHLDINSCSFTK